MKRTLQFAFLFTTLFVGYAVGQSQPFPSGLPSVSHSLVTFPVYSLNAAPVSGADIQVVGSSGQTSYCYWAVANYQIGSVMSQLGCLPNAANTLSVSNYNAIIPFFYPAGATSIDILRTSGLIPLAPTGACNCAVATGVTSGTINDQSNSLGAYTVSLLNPLNFALTLRNEVVGAGSSHLILRQGWPPGAQVADLSAGGVGCGSGTAGNLLEWLTSTTCGNAPIVDGGTAGLSSVVPSSGKSIFSTGSTTGGQVAVNGTGSTDYTNFAGYLGSIPYNQLAGNPTVALGFCQMGSGGTGVFCAAEHVPSAGESSLALGTLLSAGAHLWDLSDFNNGLTAGEIFSSCCGNGTTVSSGVNLNVPSSAQVTIRVNGVITHAFSTLGITTVAVAFSVIASLCSSSQEGTTQAVKDSTTSTWGATITGSGANHVLAYCDGTNWTVAAK